jgi:hypothetical protein
MPYSASGISVRGARGVGSRIGGRGALLRSLHGLLRRVQRFGEHRAATPAERLWAARLADALDSAYVRAAEDPGARASLVAANRRANVSRKTPLLEAES